MSFESNIIEQLEAENKQLKAELKIYADCAVCGHCDKALYPSYEYCDIGGCCGGRDGATKEDKWVWHGLNEADIPTSIIRELNESYIHSGTFATKTKYASSKGGSIQKSKPLNESYIIYGGNDNPPSQPRPSTPPPKAG